MAGRTTRRSGLGSVGVVVEMYKNLTDRAGNSCFIGPFAFRLTPNTAPHICGSCYNCLSYPLFPIVLNHRVLEYSCMLIRISIYYIFYPYFKFYRRTCVVPFTPQTRSRAASSHPLPAIFLLNFLKIPSSASSNS